MLKSNVLKLTFALVIGSVFAGCAHVNSVSLTSIPSKRSRQVKAEVSKTIFLAFNFNNDYIDSLVTDLKQQCPDGVVSGILTKDETTSYVIVFTKKVTATGFCNIASAKASNMKSRRNPADESAETQEN